VPAGTLAAYGAVSDPSGAGEWPKGVRRGCSGLAMAVTGKCALAAEVRQARRAGSLPPWRGPDGKRGASVRFVCPARRAWIQDPQAWKPVNQTAPLRLADLSR